MTSVESAVRSYFQRMAQIRSTGGATSETSYYSALENLLNELGKTLDPHVICNGQLRNQGAGHPDFGLYSRKQCSKGVLKPGQGEIPERGVIEVKPLADQSWQTVKGEQATTYFNLYRLVLVTNYREFRLIGEDGSGNPVVREFFCLANDEPTFWSMATHSDKSAREQGTHLGEFLCRVMMYAAPLSRPQDIAWFLSSYAREAQATLIEKDGATLAPLRTALELALGIKFSGEEGEHFFRSTLIQTLFYGIFSAWAIWAKDNNSGTFDWKSAGYIMTVPMIRSLFEEIAKPSRLEPLDLMDIMDHAGNALNRIDSVSFFNSFDSGEAVQHFYEPFLEAFDPQLRKKMGVWYTPCEIVKYMVERVDTVLRAELGIADGLADENVHVLDPCCGTGAFIIEVLRKIEKTLRAKGEDALIGQDVREAACERVFGFEIMSAPFVIAHWQVSNLLARLGAPVDPNKGERPALFLTNALTGWDPPSGPKETIQLFPDLEHERDQAEQIKRDEPILVVLGNPPYNAFAGTSPEEEDGLVEPYKNGLISKWEIKKFNLDELYVRFLRIAERRIAETGRGLVCYISSYSYLSDPSFVVARESLLNQFDQIWIDCLNGDSRETGKRTPSGDPDPSVFSTSYNRAGIRLGTAVGLFLKRSDPDSHTKVAYRDFWGTEKRIDLLDSLQEKPFDDQYEISNPQPWNRLSFRPRDVDSSYLAWPKLPDIGEAVPLNGLLEKRAGALIDIDQSNLEARMRIYFDSSVDWAALQLTAPQLAKNASGHNAEKARKVAQLEEAYDDSRLVRYIVRPFDIRYAYYTNTSTIWNRARPDLWTQFSPGNQFLMTRPSGVAKPEGAPVLFTRNLGDNDAQRGHSYYFPFWIHDSMKPDRESANLSAPARAWLTHLGLPEPDKCAKTAVAPWHHVLAITYAPQYLDDSADGIAIDWPRIPLPDDPVLLNASAALGARVAALLDTEVNVLGVTSGEVLEHSRVLGKISNTDLHVNVGWGSRDSKGRTNPGKGRTETREWTKEEKNALRIGFASEDIEEEKGFAMLGRAIDVHLNATTFWSGVPEETWKYVIGGYRVIKKWLSYREETIIGRPITKNEAREVTAMVRRLTALILLSDKLNANYSACRDNSYDWPSP